MDDSVDYGRGREDEGGYGALRRRIRERRSRPVRQSSESQGRGSYEQGQRGQGSQYGQSQGAMARVPLDRALTARVPRVDTDRALRKRGGYEESDYARVCGRLRRPVAGLRVAGTRRARAPARPGEQSWRPGRLELRRRPLLRIRGRRLGRALAEPERSQQDWGAWKTSGIAESPIGARLVSPAADSDRAGRGYGQGEGGFGQGGYGQGSQGRYGQRSQGGSARAIAVDSAAGRARRPSAAGAAGRAPTTASSAMRAAMVSAAAASVRGEEFRRRVVRLEAGPLLRKGTQGLHTFRRADQGAGQRPARGDTARSTPPRSR